jgi:hypothetical protein
MKTKKVDSEEENIFLKKIKYCYQSMRLKRSSPIKIPNSKNRNKESNGDITEVGSFMLTRVGHYIPQCKRH